jgi:YVTN family beta-propeller protein
LRNHAYSVGVSMSVRRVGWLAAIVFLIVLWSACGQVYRPVVIPCTSGAIPNCPVETNPQPANFHSVLGVSTNIPNYAGSAMQIDVAGDSIVGETSTSTGNSPNTGFNPTYGVILPNDSRVFVATAGSVYDKGVDAIDYFTPVFQATLATGLGVVGTISLPPLTGQSSSIVALSEAGNVVTATLSAPLLAAPSSAALVPAGTALVISGEDIPGYNGTFTISSISGTTVTFTDSLAGLGSCSSTTTLCAGAARASVPAQPVFLASIENAEMYVANFSSNSVAKISTASSVVTNAASTEPPCVSPCSSVPASNPVSMAEANAREGAKLYIANQGNNTVTSLNSIDLSSNNPATNNVTGFTGTTPVWVVARADGQKVYVVTQGDGQLATIDTATDSVSGSLSVGAGANYIFLDPNLNRLYVVNPATATVYVFSDTGGVDGNGVPNDTPVLLTTLSFASGSVACPSGCTPTSVTALLDGSRFYVASYQSVGSCTGVSGACIVPQLTVFNANSFALQYPSAPTMTLLTWPPFSTNQTGVPPVTSCALSPSYTPTSVRYRVFSVASADSTRVYVAMCDAGAVAVINTTGGNTNNPGEPLPPDALVTTLLSPYSGGAPQANGEPLPQSPIFLFMGQ